MTPTRNRRYPSADAFDGSEGRTDKAVGGKRSQPQDQGSDYGQQNGNGRHYGFNRFAVGADEDGDWSGRRLSASPDQPVVLVVGLLDPSESVRLVRAEKTFGQEVAVMSVQDFLDQLGVNYRLSRHDTAYTAADLALSRGRGRAMTRSPTEVAYAVVFALGPLID